MATASPPVPPMPDASVPIALKDGRMHPDWYKWLVAVVAILKTVRGEV